MMLHPRPARPDSSDEIVASVGFLVAMALCVVLALSLAARALGAPIGRPTIPIRNKINPNRAPVASLVRLPGLGLTRARAIIAYRNESVERAGREVAYGCPEDMRQVKGIGPATVEGLRQWVCFDPPDPKQGPVVTNTP
jgi:hypothetical protein